LTNEEWKNIPNYNGRYQISSLGRVRSLDRIIKRNKQGNFLKVGGIVKQYTTAKGYKRVQLQDNKIYKNFLVHKLVAEVFLPISTLKNKQVNHINGIKTDNNVSNLEWVTPSENLKHSYKNNLRSPKIKYIVRCNELNIETNGLDKMADILRRSGYPRVSSSGIWNCVKKISKSHFGLTFTAKKLFNE